MKIITYDISTAINIFADQVYKYFGMSKFVIHIHFESIGDMEKRSLLKMEEDASRVDQYYSDEIIKKFDAAKIMEQQEPITEPFENKYIAKEIKTTKKVKKRVRTNHDAQIFIEKSPPEMSFDSIIEEHILEVNRQLVIIGTTQLLNKTYILEECPSSTLDLINKENENKDINPRALYNKIMGSSKIVNSNAFSEILRGLKESMENIPTIVFELGVLIEQQNIVISENRLEHKYVSRLSELDIESFQSAFKKEFKELKEIKIPPRINKRVTERKDSSEDDEEGSSDEEDDGYVTD